MNDKLTKDDVLNGDAEGSGKQGQLEYVEFKQKKQGQVRLLGWFKIDSPLNKKDIVYTFKKPALCRFVTLKMIKSSNSQNVDDETIDFRKLIFKGDLILSDFYYE